MVTIFNKNLYEENIDYLNKNTSENICSGIKNYINDSTIIVCIGTDKCIGDSLGPLVGHILIERNFPNLVFGSLDDPIHALNIKPKLEYINTYYKNRTIIGIDACLGDPEDIGKIFVRNSPIHPGKGIGKNLPTIGDVSILGVVHDYNDPEPLYNKNIRLSFIMSMAKTICNSIEIAFNSKDYTIK